MTDPMAVGEDNQAAALVLDLAIWLDYVDGLATQDSITGKRLTTTRIC